MNTSCITSSLFFPASPSSPSPPSSSSSSSLLTPSKPAPAPQQTLNQMSKQKDDPTGNMWLFKTDKGYFEELVASAAERIGKVKHCILPFFNHLIYLISNTSCKHSTTSTTLHNTPQHSTTLHNTPQHSTTLHHTPQRNATQRNATQRTARNAASVSTSATLAGHYTCKIYLYTYSIIY